MCTCFWSLINIYCRLFKGFVVTDLLNIDPVTQKLPWLTTSIDLNVLWDDNRVKVEAIIRIVMESRLLVWHKSLASCFFLCDMFTVTANPAGRSHLDPSLSNKVVFGAFLCVHWGSEICGVAQTGKSLVGYILQGSVSPTCYCVSCTLPACILCGRILYYIIILCDWLHVFIEAVK